MKGKDPTPGSREAHSRGNRAERGWCCSCREWMPLEAFRPSEVIGGGRGSRCRQCRCAAVRRWRERHPEAVQEYNEQRRLGQRQRQCAECGARFVAGARGPASCRCAECRRAAQVRGRSGISSNKAGRPEDSHRGDWRQGLPRRKGGNRPPGLVLRVAFLEGVALAGPILTAPAAQRSRLVGLALRPEPRPKARRPPTRVDARGDEPRRTGFDLQGQHFVVGSVLGVRLAARPSSLVMSRPILRAGRAPSCDHRAEG